MSIPPPTSTADPTPTTDAARVLPPSAPLTQRLMEMLRRVSLADDPRTVLREYADALRQMYGTTGYLSLSCRDLAEGQYRITRRHLERVDHADAVKDFADADPWSRVHLMDVHTGGFLGDLVEAGQPCFFNDLDVTKDPVLGDALAGFRSLLAVPLFDDGLAKNWSIQLKHEPDGFNESDLERALIRGNLVGGTVRLVQATKQLREANARIQREVKKIGEIQKALLPESLPTIHGASVAASYYTYDTAGGDFYEVHPLGIDGLYEGEHNGTWGLMIADVSGHGPAAAVVMAMLQSMISCMPVEEQDAAGVLTFLNRHLSAKRIEQTFVTAFVMGYDPKDGRVWYARAGHPPPLVRRPHPDRQGDAAVEILTLGEVGGVPLGILDDAEYQNAETHLRPGDTVVMFTDGIVEARSPQGEFFGEQGVKAALRDCSGDPQCFIDTLKAHLDRFQANAKREDDQTALAFQVHEIGERPATYAVDQLDGSGI